MPTKTTAKKPVPEGQMYVAIDTGVTDVDGVPQQYFRGKTRVREGHVLLELAPQSFKPLDVHYDVENATADPGSSR
jgi:hypothetical protein